VPLALDALDQVAADHSDLAEAWSASPNGARWERGIRNLRDVLAPPVPPQEEVLFEI
jgi:hypothetical protein